MSDSLNEFALKVAGALDAYAAQGAQNISLHSVPFHRAMVKMAQALEHRKAYKTKVAILSLLAPGLLATGQLLNRDRGASGPPMNIE